MASNQMASSRAVRQPGRDESITAAEHAILELLKKENKSVEDTKDLWNKLKSMGDFKGLIKLLTNHHISRMWDVAVDTDIDIADLRAPEDKILKNLSEKSLKDKADKVKYDKAVNTHAVAAINAMLPQAGQRQVKWIGKRGSEQKGGWDSFLFPWARTSKGFPFEDNFEMTISMIQTISGRDNRNKSHVVEMEGTAPDRRNQNQYSVEIIEDKRSFLLSVERNPTSVPDCAKPCVAAFTFGNGNNDLTIYIRFAGPTMLVGKAFKANLWRDLVLAKY